MSLCRQNKWYSPPKFHVLIGQQCLPIVGWTGFRTMVEPNVALAILNFCTIKTKKKIKILTKKKRTRLNSLVRRRLNHQKATGRLCINVLIQIHYVQLTFVL